MLTQLSGCESIAQWCLRVRITIFGLTLSSSWGNGHATPYRAILRALHRLGHRVTFFEKDVPYYAAHRDLPAPDFFDLQFLARTFSFERATLTEAVRRTLTRRRTAIPSDDPIALTNAYWDGERPGSFVWELRRAMPLDFFKNAKIAAG